MLHASNGPNGPVDSRAATDSPVEELHHEKRRALVLAHFVDRAHARVRHPGGGARLAQQRRRARGGIGPQQLDRDFALESVVLAGIDDTHAAFAKAAGDPEAADELRILIHD